MQVDEHSLRDLEIFECRDGGRSIFDLVDGTRSAGGRRKLRAHFLSPHATVTAITETQHTLRFILRHEGAFAGFGHERMLGPVDKYLGSNYAPLRATDPVGTLVEAYWYRFFYPELYEHVTASATAAADLVRTVHEQAVAAIALGPPAGLATLRGRVVTRTRHDAMPEVWALHGRRAGVVAVLRADRAIRGELRAAVVAVIDAMHELDALIAMAVATRTLGLVFPTFFPENTLAEGATVQAHGLFHPFCPHPIRNHLELGGKRPLMLVTGPNMSGKTTYLKACGVAVFLAHLGMGAPVAAMRLTRFDALFVSLTVSDSVRTGHSYFFAELRRLKQAVQLLLAGQRTFVLFDEIFKGTNIRDAFEGSRQVVASFARCATSVFVISSHLAELAHAFDDDAVRRHFFDATLVGGQPAFGYQLRVGASSQRLGLVLLEREGVLDMLRRVPTAESRP